MGASKVIVVRRARPSPILRLKHMLSRPLFVLDKAKLDSFLHPEEAEAAAHLKAGKIRTDELTFFYPGCGLDIAQPLLYSSKIAGHAKNIRFVLADREITSEDVASLMLQLTNNHNYSIRKQGDDSDRVDFRFKDKRISFICRRGDVLSSIPEEILEGYDVYFERAFELFRTEDGKFMPEMIRLLNKDGLLITDAGLHPSLAKGLEKIKVSDKAKDLGFYRNLSVYRKR